MCEVHKDTTQNPTLAKLKANFEEEKSKTAECLADVCQLLSHDNSSSRLELARVLDERALMIRLKVSSEQALKNMLAEK